MIKTNLAYFAIKNLVQDFAEYCYNRIFKKKIIYHNFCDKKLMLTNNNHTVTTMRVQELEK
jgi:hypothetical protein